MGRRFLRGLSLTRLWREGCGGAPLNYRRRPLMKKTFTTALSGEGAPPLVAGATTFPPHWEACHWILSRLRLLANPVPLPPQAGALWVLAMEPCVSAGKRRNLFCPLHRGKSGAARIGGGERSEPVSRIVFKPYDTESKFRNVLASPLGEEGHKVAKGCTRVRMIMILDVDVTAERRHYNTHRP